MKRLILKKLRSNEGASLTYAILLFLVCAVIGTIVLTAGTIASGRLAEKAEMDQRYYHVVSTAEFLKDTLDNQKVVIKREKKGSDFVIKVEGYEEPLTSESEGIADNDSSFHTFDFLTLRTIELLSEYSWDADFYNTTEKTTKLEFQISGQSHIVDVKTTMKNGMMVMEIYDYTDKNKPDDNYMVRLTFAPQISEVVDKVDDVDVKTATVTWHISNIEKVFGYDK